MHAAECVRTNLLDGGIDRPDHAALTDERQATIGLTLFANGAFDSKDGAGIARKEIGRRKTKTIPLGKHLTSVDADTWQVSARPREEAVLMSLDCRVHTLRPKEKSA
jgi:hypothetical protein